MVVVVVVIVNCVYTFDRSNVLYKNLNGTLITDIGSLSKVKANTGMLLINVSTRLKVSSELNFNLRNISRQHFTQNII